MADWFRSVTVLGAAFAAAVVVTIGLSNVIVSGSPEPVAGGGDDPSGSAPPAPLVPIEGIGGHLTVTGDREGTLTLLREDNNSGYALEGDGTRMVFEGSPPDVAIAQVAWDGLNFFPEPSDCTITPGELDDSIGVGYAEISCTELTDIRDNGTVDINGTLGVALTLVGVSDLPDMGGSVTVGDETWEFDEAFLFAFASAAVAGEEDYNMILTHADTGEGCPGPACARTSLRFKYDVQTHQLALVNVERGGEDADVAGCNLGQTELGRLTPTTAVVELSIDCPAADVPGLGTVPITGTVIIQQVDFVP
jgi:hypothetical protein